MEKLPMCRICLAQNVRMYVVVNGNLHELYEKLTDVPFLTEDSRLILACVFCCAKLKQCYRLLRQCLEAEELFAQMMNEDYKPNALINQNHLEFCSGFIKSPIEHISIDDECVTENIAIKEELPAVCERLDDIIDPEEEHRSDGSAVAKTPKLETRRTKPVDTITAEQTKKEKSAAKVIRTTQKRTDKPGIYFKEPYKCDQLKEKSHLSTHNIRIHTGEKPCKCDVCQRSFSIKSHLTKHIRIHTGEKPHKCDVCQRSFSKKSLLTAHYRIHTGEKPYKCDVCQHSFSQKSKLTVHYRIHTDEKP